MRRSTTMLSIDGASLAASSAVVFERDAGPLRHASSWVMSALAPVDSSRSPSDSAEKPPKTTTWGAPIRAHASIATGSSGTMPM